MQRAFGGLVEAARSLNAERYLDYFDKDKFTYLNEDGTVGHSFEEFGQIYRAGIASVAKYESLEFDRVKIVVIDRSTVVLVNEYSANLILGSGDVVSVSGAGTQVWSNRSGAWKLVSVSSSVKPKDVL